MDREELKEILLFLQKVGANPQLCDTEVPCFETSVRAGLPTENWAEEAFVEMMSLPRKMLVSNPAMIVDVNGDSMVDAGISDGDRVLKLKYTGKIDEAKKVIDENMENEVFNQLCMRGNDISYTQSQVELIIKKYEKYYKMLNCEMPAEIKNIKVGKVVGEFTTM